MAPDQQPELFSGTTDTARGEPTQLICTLDASSGCIRLIWGPQAGGRSIAVGILAPSKYGFLNDALEFRLAPAEGKAEHARVSAWGSSVHAFVRRLQKRFPVADEAITIQAMPATDFRALRRGIPHHLTPRPEETSWKQLARLVSQFANLVDRHRDRSRFDAPPPSGTPLLDNIAQADLTVGQPRSMDESKPAPADPRRGSPAPRRDGKSKARFTSTPKAHPAAPTRSAAAARTGPAAEKTPPAAVPNAPDAALKTKHDPIPPVSVRVELPALTLQDTAFPLADLRPYFLRERAALWWVSNQSDDLLALPYCQIERLEYQVRTALRVLGPLRGRALLSDEVGLGKTIEAGLVLKEYLTRGMIKRFLVLTVPSLVDQWEEELAAKFGLTTTTTNHAAFRADPAAFWRAGTGIVASLHTLKQPAHLAVAREVNWDLLIVDEAHYLRNATSQAWQAVNGLPRQFLLLLTATPVQNSLEDLYNLVTLLQPGQLPSPREFRARFIDAKRPHQPREPEELRRLLGQVMIRNTRANAGVNLPPRRAETVMFEPEPAEREFWQRWDAELRAKLAGLSASQSSLWGRLLLQAAGSSPAAWRQALGSFPDRAAARAWCEAAPLEASWQKKADLLVPLTRGAGGVVIFTQFLETQAALVERLRAAGVPTFFINGQTPPPERQPITEGFRARGGALLLTHSGTEGRNLQFSHRLVNFDLPWNPMEIEQRIGRLHRLGQQHPVRIYNLVQAGTLQEHLLQILQEKLNLFELVVGETGLILGERFGSDEFAEEVLRRWRESEGRVAEAMESLGNELAAARATYGEVRQLDETLFAHDYESL